MYLILPIFIYMPGYALLYVEHVPLVRCIPFLNFCTILEWWIIVLSRVVYFLRLERSVARFYITLCIERVGVIRHEVLLISMTLLLIFLVFYSIILREFRIKRFIYPYLNRCVWETPKDLLHIFWWQEVVL